VGVKRNTQIYERIRNRYEAVIKKLTLDGDDMITFEETQA